MSSIRAIAWDIDGTLIDSEPLHDSVLTDVCTSYGVDLSDLAPNHFLGIHIPDIWAALQPRMPAGLVEAQWSEALISRYVERAHELEPFADAVDVMRSFAAAGLKQVCVSNSGRRVVDANLAALGIHELIDFSLSFDDVTKGKPHPEPYLSAARRLGIPAEAMAAVEDSVAGATSASKAGYRVFGIAPAGKPPIPPAHVTIGGLAELPAHILSSTLPAT